MFKISLRASFFVVALMMCSSSAAFGQGTAFTYQGKLADNGNPANGHYDFQFTLYDAASGGAQQGTPQTVANQLVTNGIFAVTLDFVNCSGCICPTCFNGGPRFLAIAVRPTGGGSFTPLTERQPITSTPYAVKSMSAANAATADGLSVACINCITSSQIQSIQGSQVSGNIAGSQINGTIPVASVPDLGASYIKNTAGQQSSANFNISGDGTAGGTLGGSIVNATTQFNLNGVRILSAGNQSLSVGVAAGASTPNNALLNNAFFGFNAGHSSDIGDGNSFFGAIAGFSNTDGRNNSFFGEEAGRDNTTEGANTFIGFRAGQHNGQGDSNNSANFNTFVGNAAGLNNTTGFSNTFVGEAAGISNVFGNNNTVVGFHAHADNLVNATAIGASAFVVQDNSLVLGSINGVNNATADTNVGIGTTAPATRLHISGSGIVRARVNSDSNAGLALTLNNQPKWSVATTTGGNLLIFNDAITQNAFFIDAATNVIGINALGPAGSTQLCRNASNQVSTCSSSMRYKDNITCLHSGLNLINRLRPVTFDWKQNGEHDLGLVAEEVAKVEPLLVTKNDKGEIEGVKYDRVAVVLINVVKEQQQQIDALKQIVCLDHPTAEICRDSKGALIATKAKPERE